MGRRFAIIALLLPAWAGCADHDLKQYVLGVTDQVYLSTYKVDLPAGCDCPLLMHGGESLLASPVERFAVVDDLIVGRTVDGMYFVVDDQTIDDIYVVVDSGLIGREEADPVQMFEDQGQWQAALAELGILDLPVLENPKAVAQKRPRTEVQYWRYRNCKGWLGLTDAAIGLGLLALAIVIPSSMGLIGPERDLVRNLMIHLSSGVGGFYAGVLMLDGSPGVGVILMICLPLLNHKIAMAIARRKSSRVRASETPA